jgi:hypothetical protein
LALAQTVFSAESSAKIAKFDHQVLEDTLKKVIVDSPLKLQPDALFEEPYACKTFVVAIALRGTGAVPELMRTYGAKNDDASTARIWEAGRATSAALTFFEPITIDHVKYGDGGAGWNNPTAEAIAEAHNIWPGRRIGCLVSIGTGLEDAIQLDDGGHGLSQGLLRWAVDKGLPERSFKIDVAEYCVASLTSCEKMHHEVSHKYPDRIFPNRNYFRFNVPQGMSKIGLEEWKKLEDMVALTRSYMKHGDIVDRKQTIARVLLNPKVAS